jgi:hypothetical protein
VNNLPSLKNVSPSILSKAKEIEEKSNGLLEGVKSILIQVSSPFALLHFLLKQDDQSMEN